MQFVAKLHYSIVSQLTKYFLVRDSFLTFFIFKNSLCPGFNVFNENNSLTGVFGRPKIISIW